MNVSVWHVPQSPAGYEVNNLVFWNGISMPSTQILMQPELWYGGATNTWWSSVQIVQGNNVIFNLGTCPALPGDQITGSIFLESGRSGYGETWEVEAYNARTGCYDLGEYTFSGNGWGPFSRATYGIVEIQGLSACHGVPASGFVEFDLAGLTQIGTDNEWVDVRAPQAWVKNEDTTSEPLCNWHNYLSTDTYQDVMQVQWDSW
jgi:hypothetical protein